MDGAFISRSRISHDCRRLPSAFRLSNVLSKRRLLCRFDLDHRRHRPALGCAGNLRRFNAGAVFVEKQSTTAGGFPNAKLDRCDPISATP
jgi:hypothetical protein